MSIDPSDWPDGTCDDHTTIPVELMEWLSLGIGLPDGYSWDHDCDAVRLDSTGQRWAIVPITAEIDYLRESSVEENR